MSLDAYHLIRLFKTQAQQRADQIVLEGFEIQAPWNLVTWQKLEEQTDKLAKVLIKLGVSIQDKCAFFQNLPAVDVCRFS